MSNETGRILAPILTSVKSGRVKVSINSENPFTMEVVGGILRISLPEHYLSHRSFRKVRDKITDMNMLKDLARILSKSSMKVDVYAGNRKIFSMGEGVSSMLGNEKVYFVNLLKAMRKG